MLLKGVQTFALDFGTISLRVYSRSDQIRLKNHTNTLKQTNRTLLCLNIARCYLSYSLHDLYTYALEHPSFKWTCHGANH